VTTVVSQLAVLRGPRPVVRLVRPCTRGDGIQTIPERRLHELAALTDEAATAGRLMKFVPASGAATRMFRPQLESLRSDAPGSTEGAHPDLFMRGLTGMPFYKELRRSVAASGGDLDLWARAGRRRDILEHLLGEKGLAYATLPKGLLPFHSYPDGARTALEEHLHEVILYAAEGSGLCRLHFTVSPQHLRRFRSAAAAAVSRCAQRHRVRCDVGISTQHASTDTPALDAEGRPFRLKNGRLLFRAGGHGALLRNLNDQRGDVVFITNVDNIVPDWLKPDRVWWKKVLAGYFLHLQGRVFECLRRLQDRTGAAECVRRTATFSQHELGIELPAWWSSAGDARRSEFLFAALNRPLRVCGMVRNEGEPGGGPFWVESGGTTSKQIVESAQVDTTPGSQRRILESATHFNPVDMVCGVRDYRGVSFNLDSFADQGACFASSKSHDGRPLMALELPGLWNGGMAHWLTVFVEVPAYTFTPVKTVLDFLRPEHQPPPVNG
jgi:hypothetical protein